MSAYRSAYKTRVSQTLNGQWRVLYVWPYGGLSERRYPTWRAALHAAIDLECRLRRSP